QKDFGLQIDYDKGFKLNELFPTNNVGIVTSRDSFVIDDNKDNLIKRIEEFYRLGKAELIEKYGLKENSSWKIEEVKLKSKCFNDNSILRINYRPFDSKFIYYDAFFIERPRKEVMKNFYHDNIGI